MFMRALVKLPEVAQRFFEPADWRNDPYSLLDPVRETDAKVFALHRETGEKIRRTIKGGPKKEYMQARGLGAYEVAFNLKKGALSNIIDLYRNKTGLAAVSVIDAGCGEGRATEQMFVLDAVDENESIGITIHEPNSSRSKIAEVNIAEIKPKKEGGNMKRFDLFTCSYGALTYHPMNRIVNDCNDFAFALLQAINFVKDGGLIFSKSFSYMNISSSDFISMGILELAPEHNQFTYFNYNPACVLRVVRRPSPREILKLLRVEDSKEYSMF